MKTMKILAVSLFATSAAFAQDMNPADVPSNLKEAFTKEFTNATDVEWEKDMENYKVEFDMGRMDHEVWYNLSGNLVKKEIEISEAELPQNIRDAVKSNYAGYRVDDIEMVWQNNVNTYEVELEKGSEDKHVTFDEKAKVVNERTH